MISDKVEIVATKAISKAIAGNRIETVTSQQEQLTIVSIGSQDEDEKFRISAALDSALQDEQETTVCGGYIGAATTEGGAVR